MTSKITIPISPSLEGSESWVEFNPHSTQKPWRIRSGTSAIKLTHDQMRDIVGEVGTYLNYNTLSQLAHPKHEDRRRKIQGA